MADDNRICAECVKDTYLKELISINSDNGERCEYCSSTSPTIAMHDLASRIDKVIENFYELSSQSDAVLIFERTPEGATLKDVVRKFVSDPALQDLLGVLEELWFDRDSQESIYGEDPWFARRTSHSNMLNRQWWKMEESLRREARFVNPPAVQLLERVFGPLMQDRTADGMPVIVDAGPDTAIHVLYRARVFQTFSLLEEQMKHPERALGPPPSSISSAGRMNAKGISVFYGATDRDIAVAEVRPPVGSLVVIAAFTVIRRLRLLDLNRLTSIELDPDLSLFDPTAVERATRCHFLRELEQKLVMPVMPELSDEGYLTTQLVADFLATHAELSLDGIVFRSVQVSNTPGAPQGRNVILFTKASKVLNSEEWRTGTAEFSLWESDEEGTRMEPRIRHEVPPSNKSKLHDLLYSISNPALELDVTAQEIREILGVKYHDSSYPISV